MIQMDLTMEELEDAKNTLNKYGVPYIVDVKNDRAIVNVLIPDFTDRLKEDA